MRKKTPGFEKYEIDEHGNVFSFYSNKFLKHKPNTHGYATVGLYAFGKRKTWAVHILVGKLFIENLGGKPQLNHKNGNKMDPDIENLEWVTVSENVKHSYEKLYRKMSRRKLSSAQAFCIKSLLVHGAGQRALGRIFNANSPTINGIASGKLYRYQL